MTFGEKVKQARLSQNLSQTELAQATGISERSLYTYEQANILPRKSNLAKLADALNVSVGYLLDEYETDAQPDADVEMFLANVKNEYGSRGAREANELLQRAYALFAGGELDDSAKELFFRSIMEVYLESKSEARIKFSSKSRVSRNRKGKQNEHN
jgi:transcriptional regulator with XRE-family HTH domain